MSKVEIKPATPRVRELHIALAQRLDGMAANLGRLEQDRAVLPPDEVAELRRRIRAAARDVREFPVERASILPKKNPAVMPAYRLLMRAETQIGAVREALLARLEEGDVDPTGGIVRKLEEISAQIEQTVAIVEGRGETQA